jgi:hypothetical protein
VTKNVSRASCPLLQFDEKAFFIIAIAEKSYGGIVEDDTDAINEHILVARDPIVYHEMTTVRYCTGGGNQPQALTRRVRYRSGN